MSLNDLSAFFEKLQDDPELQEKVRAVFGAEDREEALCSLAEAEGFTFTVEELRSEQAKPSVGALDDAALHEVVGGTGSLPGFGPGPRLDGPLSSG
jgi:predicted ribosomally synthesized peptide with nif11-like leader